MASGGVAQLVRACGSYPQCPGFKSLHRHQSFQSSYPYLNPLFLHFSQYHSLCSCIQKESNNSRLGPRFLIFALQIDATLFVYLPKVELYRRQALCAVVILFTLCAFLYALSFNYLDSVLYSAFRIWNGQLSYG